MRVLAQVTPSLSWALEMGDKRICVLRFWLVADLLLHSFQVLPARLCAHPAACVWHGREWGLSPPDHWHAVRRPPQHQLPGVHLQLLWQAMGGEWVPLSSGKRAASWSSDSGSPEGPLLIQTPWGASWEGVGGASAGARGGAGSHSRTLLSRAGLPLLQKGPLASQQSHTKILWRSPSRSAAIRYSNKNTYFLPPKEANHRKGLRPLGTKGMVHLRGMLVSESYQVSQQPSNEIHPHTYQITHFMLWTCPLR